MDAPNHYELLCVTPEATADDIRAAYRRLIRVYHPDVASAAGEAMTLRLNDAQRELLDPDRRARYDNALRRPDQRRERAQEPSRPFRPQPGPAWTPPPTAPRTRRAAPQIFAHPGAWMGALIVSICLVLATTAIVFLYCYPGPMTLTTPRLVPPIVVGIAWLVGALSKPPKLLIALMVIGAALWPLAAAGVQPFTIFDALPSAVLPALTILAVAVIVLRTSAPRASYLVRGRPVRHTSAA